MKSKQDRYEPVINFRKNRPQMQVKHIQNDKLYEQAFFPEQEKSQSEYSANTTTWD